MKLLRFSKFSFIIVLFLAAILSLSAAAQPLAPSEIDALRAQLVKARDVATALSSRVRCYVDKDTDFQARSSQLQQTAGGLHLQERKLSGELEQAQFEAESFRRDFEGVLQEMDKLQNKRGNIEVQILKRQAELDNCKRTFGIFGFLCDWAGEIAGLNNELRKLSAEGKAANIRADSLQRQIGAAQIRQGEATDRLREKQIELAQIKRDIEMVEAEIKVIKASLSEIRAVKQACSVQCGKFDRAFAEFEGPAQDSDRAPVVRRLRRESAELDDLLEKAGKLLDKNGLQLPSGERICAH